MPDAAFDPIFGALLVIGILIAVRALGNAAHHRNNGGADEVEVVEHDDTGFWETLLLGVAIAYILAWLRREEDVVVLENQEEQE